MPQDDVTLVLEARRQFEVEEFEAIGSTWHEDGLVTAPEGWPEPGPFEGRDAVEGQFRRLASGLGRHHFRDIAYHVVDGRFKAAHFRWTPEEALEAAGLAD